MRLHTDDRGKVTIVTAILTFATLAGLLALAPYYYHFIGLVSAEADPLTSMLLQLVVPVLFLGVIVSVGVSALGGGA